MSIYHPYLRGLRHELLALRAVAPELAGSGKVVPLIEPVRADLSHLRRTATVLADAGVPFAVVTNPTVGEIVGTDALADAELAALRAAHPALVRPAYVVLSSTRAERVRRFVGAYAAGPVAVAHLESCDAAAAVRGALAPLGARATHIFFDAATSEAYRTGFCGGGERSVLLRDGFRRRAKNAESSAIEFFGDLHRTFARAHQGFGDFATVGETFDDGGDPARVIALHLTYEHLGGAIAIRHFVSDRTDTAVDPAGAFLEALDQLVAFLDRRPAPVAETGATRAFRDLHARRHFPGLGTAKELSIRHHLELVASLL